MTASTTESPPMKTPPKINAKNLENLYFVTANSSTMTSLAATYRNVPVEIARMIPSNRALEPDRASPSPIPRGEKKEKRRINLIKVLFSVPAFVKLIP